MVQGTVGNFGPIGQAIQMGSQAGMGATQGSESDLVRGGGQMIFNPSSNIDALSDDEISPLGKAMGMILPGSGEFFRKEKSGPDIGREDPRQVERLLELDRISKNIEAGTDAATQNAIRQNQANVAQTQSRIGRATGGASGATVDALIKAQRAGDTASNQAFAQGQARIPAFQGMIGQLQNRVEQRALELDLLNRAQFQAEKAQSDKEQKINKQGQQGLAFAQGMGSGENAEGMMGMFGGMFGGGANTPEAGGISGGMINPNDNLDQITTDPNQRNPSVDLGNISQGTEVTGLMNTGGSSFF